MPPEGCRHRRRKGLPQATQKGGMAAEKEAAERQKKHTECAVPTGTNFPKGKLQSFLPYFLYFTKSRKKCRLWRQKDLILLERSRHCGELHRGLQNLDVPGKGTSCYFLRRAKSNQKHARTCKKLPVASFCASETAETGRIANGREQGDHVSRRSRVATLWTPGDDSNLRSIHDFYENDRRSSSNRLCRELQAFRVSPVRI